MFGSIARRAAHSAALMAPLFLGACAVFQPYPNLPTPALLKTCPANFPSVCQAAQEIDAFRADKIEHRRNETTATRASLTLLTFGAAAAAGASALYGAHRDLVLGLGLGAAGTYSLASLYVPASKTQMYNAANSALRCVVTNGLSPVGTHDILAAKRRTLDPAKSRVDDALDVLPAAQKDRREKANAALGQLARADLNLAGLRSMDAAIANNMVAARDKIIEALATELEKSEPSIQAFFEAGTNVPGVASSFVRSAPAPVSAPAAPAGPAAAPPQTGVPKMTVREAEDVLDTYTPIIAATAAEINSAVAEENNRVNQLSKSCAPTFAAVAKLAASQTSVTLGKDARHVINFTGGKMPLSCNWIGKQPKPGEIDCITLGNGVALVTGQTLSAGNYTLVVRDSQAAPNEVEIAVEAK
jgi:hypothetical protein